MLTPAQLQTLSAAAAAYRSGKPKDALGQLKGLPQVSDVLHLRALALSAMGEISEAEDTFRKALKGAARPGEILTNHANMLARQDEPAKAAALYSEAKGKPGAPANLAVSYAKVLVAADQPEEAARMLAEDYAGLASDASAQNVLGTAFKSAERFSEARQAYDRSIALKPDHAEALINRAHLSQIEGKRDAANADLTVGVQHGRSNLGVVLAAARHLSQDGQTDAAHAAYTHALRLAPQRADIHAELNRYLWEIGRRDAFLESYRQVKDQVSADLRLKLLVEAGSLALRAEDRETTAREFFAEAASLAPDHPYALVGVAEAAADQDKEVAWSNAVRLAGGHQEVGLGYAWFLLNRGRAEEAEATLNATDKTGAEQLFFAYDSTAARMLGRERYKTYYDLDRVTAVRPISPPGRFGSLESFLSAVDEALDPLFQRAAAPVDQTLFGGQQTAGSLWETANPVLLELREAMMAVAQSFWDELSVEEGHPLYRTAKRRLGFGGSWAVRLTSGGGHTDHIHPNGLFSSAHYLRVPSDIGTEEGASAGCLRLGRPNLETIDLPAERVIRPEEGTLILFPSYMWHGVEAFESEKVRVTTPADFVERA
ncbi:MAG: putative 2OG-Fe(II) oxygenase [Pseudomonadota bacterium]